LCLKPVIYKSKLLDSKHFTSLVLDSFLKPLRKYVVFLETLTTNTEKEIDQIVNILHKNGQFSGALLVSANGDIVYKKAVGSANLEDSIPNTCDTKFLI